MADEYNRQHATRRGTCAITTAATLPTAFFGEPYSVTLAQTGATGTVTWTLVSGALPTGISLSSSGVISGTPTVDGAFLFVVRASSGTTSCTKQLSLAVEPLGPDAWWKMDGLTADPVDEVGPYTLAFLFNSAGIPGVSGKIADAFELSADDNQTCAYGTSAIGALANLGTGVEILFWLRFDAITYSANLFPCQFIVFATFAVGTDFYTLQLRYDETNTPNVLQLRLLFNGVPTVSVSTAHVPAIGVWRFIRMNFDAATGRIGLAIDNSALNQSAPGALPASSSGQIGMNTSAGAFNTMIVSVDELGVFLTNLTTAQVDAIYNSGAGETCCPLGP